MATPWLRAATMLIRSEPLALPIAGIDTVILAGGLGTRLSSILSGRQKVLAEVGGQPFLAKLLDFYSVAGAERIILAAGHRASEVENFVTRQDGAPQIVVSIEPSPRGTGGALRHALPYLQSSTVLVANGDSFAAFNLAALVKFHHERRSVITLALAFAENTARYGRVEIGERGDVLKFEEKPATVSGSPPVSGYINAGIYLMNREVIAGLPADATISLEREVFPQWLGRGLFALAADVPFIDIGTPASWREAETFFAELELASHDH